MKKVIVRILIALVVLFPLRYCGTYVAIDYDNYPLLKFMSVYNPMVNNRRILNIPPLNAIFFYNETPLVCAIRRDNYEAVKILLQNGADSNAVYGWEGNFSKPLEYCLLRGGKNRYKIAKLLLDYGAKYRSQTAYLEDLIAYDEPESNHYKYELFVDWFETNDFDLFDSKDYKYIGLIRSAIWGNSYNELKYLLDNFNIDLNYKHEQDDIPYVVLAIRDHKPLILKLLIEYGADIDIIYKGQTLVEMLKSDELASKEEYERESDKYVIVDYTQVNDEMLNILMSAQDGKVEQN